MAAETHVKVGTTFRKIGNDGVFANVSGVWQPVEFIYNNVNGTWENTYVRDTTGPSSPAAVTATWEGSGIRVNWTNPVDADYAYMRVLFWPQGEPSILPEIIVSAPTNTLHWSAYIKNHTIYTVYLTPVDTHGNAGASLSVQTMAWTGAARGRTPTQTFFDLVDSGIWVNPGAGGYWAAATRVEQGYWNLYGQYTGVYFYGTQFYDYLRGSTISSASLMLGRANEGGLPGGVTPELYYSTTTTSKASNPEGQGLSLINGTPLAIDGSLPWWSVQTLTSAWRTAMASPSLAGSIRSIHQWSTDSAPIAGGKSASYMKMFAKGDGPGTIVPGRVTVEHSG